MFGFSRDVDLARFEPGVFGSWVLSSQVVCSGTNGIVSGVQFTASGVDFSASQVTAGGVIWLESADGSIAGAFEVVRVDDETHLTVSVMRADESAAAVPIGVASGLTWRIVSYAVQAYEVLWQISQRLGLGPGAAGADYDVDDIVNADSLRAASVFGVLAMIFQALYSGAEGQAVLREKAEYYQWLFDEAMGRVAVKVDTDGDGDGERVVEPGVVCLVRV
jgi:hypothetical protein